MIFTAPVGIRRTRLIVRKGDEYISLLLKDVVIIYRVDAVVFVMDKNGKKYLCDSNLSTLEMELDASLFFRANRQYIINIDYVRSFKTFEKVKLEIFMKITHAEHQIVISQKTAPLFKKWISDELN